MLITSAATVHQVDEAPANVKATEVPGLWLQISPSEGQKCSRCWHHRDEVGQDTSHPELCERCIENIDGDGEIRAYA